MNSKEKEMRDQKPRNKKLKSRLIAAIIGMAIGALAIETATAQTAATQMASPYRESRPSTAYPGGKWEPGPARYGIEIVNDLPVTMDDGVVLNASVAFPTDLQTGKRASGRFPVVIEHMPYVRLAAPVNVNTYFAQHGYIT